MVHYLEDNLVDLARFEINFQQLIGLMPTRKDSKCLVLMDLEEVLFVLGEVIMISTVTIVLRQVLLQQTITNDSESMDIMSVSFVLRMLTVTLKTITSSNMELKCIDVLGITTLMMEKLNVTERLKMKIVLLDIKKLF